MYAQDAGSRHHRAMAKRLIEAGYGNVYVFDGGVQAWTDAGFALEEEEGE